MTSRKKIKYLTEFKNNFLYISTATLLVLIMITAQLVQKPVVSDDAKAAEISCRTTCKDIPCILNCLVGIINVKRTTPTPSITTTNNVIPTIIPTIISNVNDPNKTYTGYCPKDIKVCPDGTKINRSEPSCQFYCPESTKYCQKKINELMDNIDSVALRGSACNSDSDCIIMKLGWAYTMMHDIRANPASLSININYKNEIEKALEGLNTDPCLDNDEIFNFPVTADARDDTCISLGRCITGKCSSNLNCLPGTAKPTPTCQEYDPTDLTQPIITNPCKNNYDRSAVEGEIVYY